MRRHRIRIFSLDNVDELEDKVNILLEELSEDEDMVTVDKIQMTEIDTGLSVLVQFSWEP